MTTAKATSSKNGSGIIRVLVAATSAIRRAGLESTVKSTTGLKLAGSVPTLGGISAHARALQPDVILTDLDHPEPQFMATISPTVAAGMAVVFLIDAPTAAWTAQALRTGIKAILPREAPCGEVTSAIRAVHAGLVMLDPAVTQNLVHHVRMESAEFEPEAFDELTRREIEILRMLAEGVGNKQIAAQLNISEHTVKFHISSILDKLGAATRTEAVTSGIRMGLILV